MKLTHRTAAFALSLAVMMAFVPAKAQTNGFQVTIYGGSNGEVTVDGVTVDDKGGVLAANIVDAGDCIKVTNLEYGDVIIFNNASVTVTGDKDYYVKGLKPGGRDNSYSTTVRDKSGKTNIRTAVEVKMDSNYVVAYGVRGNEVGYEVRYLDKDGNQLFPSEKYTGQVGEYNVVSYKYIEGYTPQGYNYGKTLSVDEAENVYTIVYTKVVPKIIYVPAEDGEEGDVVEEEVPETTEEPKVEEKKEEPEVAPETDDDNTPGRVTDKNDDASKVPQDIIDLDDPNTPLGALISGINPTVLYVGGGGLGALILVYIATRKKKTKK